MRRLMLPIALVALLGCDRPKVIVTDETTCAPVRLLPVPDAGYLPYGHSHNDYEQVNPLTDALNMHLYSVEADVWNHSDKVVVSHDSFSVKGTLQELYLDPLQARVDAYGSVYGDGVPFVLWLDLKEGSYGLRLKLKALLETYPMFTIFTEDAVTAGPVTAVLTGNEESKKAFVNEFSDRRAVRDSNEYLTTDPPANNRWQYYALSWKEWIAWDGSGDFPSNERKRLECLVGDIHSKGRKVRFWANPNTAEYGQAAVEAGIDFIGSDDVEALSAFLSSVPP